MIETGVTNMAKVKHLRILNTGVQEWNKWRVNNPSIRPDLRGANLESKELIEVDLHKADLRGTNLMGANLSKVNLSGAVLREANLSRAILIIINSVEKKLDEIRN